MRQIVDILGYSVDNLTMDEAVGEVDGFIRSGEPHQITVINANKIYLADKDPDLLQIIQTSDLVIPEQAIIIASKILRRPLKERVSGIELMRKLLEEAASKCYRIYLLGAKHEVVDKLAKICYNKGINIVGYFDGYFDDDENVLMEIQKTKPDILFVALGSPRQEFWIRKQLQTIKVPVCIGVGGSFDVLAGYKKEAPNWTRCGLEWIYRMRQDRRLWKRYFTVNPNLLWKIIKYHFVKHET